VTLSAKQKAKAV